MKFEIPPVQVSDLVPFTSTQNFNASFAGVSKNGLWMWLVCDTTINIYHTENSEWFGSYCFGDSLKNPAATITAVTEFSSSHLSFPCLLIAVNHDHESLICMFDVNISKVVRAVLVPEKVVSLEVISGNGGACVDTLHLFTQLRYMFGIIAVGTSAGHIYFLDLCLDEEFSCNENLPNITLVSKKYELIPERREMAIAKQQHVFMLLNDQSVRRGSAEFESRNSFYGNFPYGKVCVTALKYIQSTVSLAVGFNFGGIQLWDLQDMCLLYTVANQPEEQAVIAFAFQEPENDPRHFCYLWIVKGHSSDEKPEEFSIATMYSLVYDKRTYVESFGYLYSELRNCFKRFEYRMTSNPFSAAQTSSAAGSCLLSCQTVCQTDESHLLDVCSLNDSDTAPENMSLCFLSWVVWSHSENTPMSYHLALFDLNQWYRAEMPSSIIRCDPSEPNPYFAHFSLEEVAQVFDLESLLGVYAIPHSIKKFKYILPSEEFFFPSSLDFQTIAFSKSGLCKSTFMGLQKRLLYDIADLGPSVLVNPKNYYSNLMRCGLISDSHSLSDRVPLIVQREALMQLALEYHMPYFFMKCLKEWRYADSIQEGCTSRALLNWAWKKVIQIKSSIDKLTIPLFNCSGSDIDKAPLKSLHSYRRQLYLIDTILMGYQKYAAPRTEQGIQELKCRKDVVFYINMYLQVLLWLRSVRILPEICEGEETEKNVLYPINLLLNSYSQRRSNLKKIHSSIGPTDILVIDGLIKEAFSENTWQEKGGNGLYPPPSIYAVLSCYLLDDVHIELKHSLMYYLLLDICNAPHNRKSPLASEVKKFPSVFGMSQSVTKLVEAFWYLDQFNFEVAIKKLLHPVVKSSDVLPWQHRRVIKLFLYQREACKALKYINHMDPSENTIEDVKLHLSVLLARGAVVQAFDYQRTKQSTGFGNELLHHLFLGCQEMHKLKDLMYLPLNSLESSALVKFLSENEDPRAQEALVMYYLLHCNFFEAAKINEKLSLTLSGRSTSTRERTAGRDALVEGLLASVPKTEKNLIDEINRFPNVSINKAESLKPLSLSIKSVPMKQITYSDILNILLSEASSAMCAPYLDPQTPFRSSTKSGFENLPFLRPPLTPECKKISSENIFSTPVTKRTLTSPSSEFSSPSKRSRLLDNAPFKTPLSNRKIPKHLAGDVASLLQSPPIHRRNSKQAKDVLQHQDYSTSAPQGILKKKAENIQNPVLDVYTSKTPSVLSDAGEDSNSNDDVEMVSDDVPVDAPVRQIRFSVPSTEDPNTSTVTVESLSSISSEFANVPVKVEELKPRTSMERYSSDLQESIYPTRRNILQGLTREPLKGAFRDSPAKILSRPESNKFVFEKSNNESRITSLGQVSEGIVYSVDETESDSCSSTADEESKKNEDNVAVQSSSYFPTSSPQSVAKMTETILEQSENTCRNETSLNISASSSGNSSYNSAASDRSFIVTPRKPLRHSSSRNTSLSSCSMLSAQENEKDQTLLGNKDDDEASKSSEDNDDADGNGTTSQVLGIQTKATIESNERVEEHSKASIESNERVEEEPSTFQNAPVFKSVTTPSTEDIIIQDSDSESASVQEKFTPTLSDIFFQRTAPSNEKIDSCIVDSESETRSTESSDVCVCDDAVSLNSVQTHASHDNTSDNLSCNRNFNIDEAGMSQNMLTVETLEDTNSGSKERTFLGDYRHQLDDIAGEQLMDSSGSQITQSTNSQAPEMFNFNQDAPPSSIPEYVPIKERVNRTLQSVSSISKYDEDDETCPSLLLEEQRELEKYGSLFESERLDILKPPSVALSSETPDQKLGDKEVSSQPMETDLPTLKNASSSRSISPPVLASKDFSQKLNEHFDFLSNNSDFYENNRLYQETMNLLRQSDVPQSFKYDPEKKSRKTRTFVFKKEESSKCQTEVVKPEDLKAKADEEISKLTESGVLQLKKDEALKSKQIDETNKSEDLRYETIEKFESSTTNVASSKFLESWHPETYEQFSSSIQQGRTSGDQKETFKSSPNTMVEKSSVSSHETDEKSEQSILSSNEKKNQETFVKSTPVNRRQKSSAKKSTVKGKSSKKAEFSFAEPHSPAGPEILEALTTTPTEYPVGSFMFSPPLTRGRLRQKRLDESLGSSFASAASDTSFAKPRKPPVDPILEEIMAEKAPESQKLPSTSKSKPKSLARKKISSKKTSKTPVTKFELSDTSLNPSETDSPLKPLSSTKYQPKLSMMLRRPQSNTGKRTEQLF